MRLIQRLDPLAQRGARRPLTLHASKSQLVGSLPDCGLTHSIGTLVSNALPHAVVELGFEAPAIVGVGGGLHAFEISIKKACLSEQACGGCYGLFARDNDWPGVQQVR